jgi:hypothetical protein
MDDVKYRTEIDGSGSLKEIPSGTVVT